MSHVLTLNAGSSSLKFGLFLSGGNGPSELADGLIDRIGGAAALKLQDAGGVDLARRDLGADEGATHAAALAAGLADLATHFPEAQVQVVGHRVVHGGPDYAAPMEVTAEVLSELERLAPFAPLHQPHNLSGIRAAQAAFPDARQVACFDTAFHRNHPFVNDVFALPRSYYDKGVRRYGFHGLSYDFIAGELARIAPQIAKGRVIVAHLGNGASMCGMIDGRSIASSMGFSALDGLPMGTRTGQLDPGVMLYLMEQEGLSASEISDLLYKKSGLLGLSGISNDMRTLEASDDPQAREAIDYFTFRIRRELGGLAAALDGIDALVFTAGIGENSARVREEVCRGTGWLGIEIDPARNAAHAQVISTEHSRVRVMVLPTNEELVIARAAARLMGEGT